MALPCSEDPFIPLQTSLLLNQTSIPQKTLAYALILDEQMSVKNQYMKNNHIMKTISNSKKLRPLSLLAFSFILVSLALTSCMKDGGSTSLSTFVQVTNSAEGSVPQDFYLDSAKVSTSAVAYGSSSAYLKTTPGNHLAKFKNSGTANANASLSLSLEAGQYYSVFYADGNASASFQDDRTAPQAGKAKVRFINLSSALSSTVDFAAAGGAKLVSNLAYKTASAYYDIDAATAFSLYLSGSSSVLVSIPATLQAGHIYTIYVSGATSTTITSHVVTEK